MTPMATNDGSSGKTGGADPKRPSTTGGKKRILLVDDHALVRSGMSELIEREADLRICGEAEDAANALQLVREQKPDLVVIDISLKEGSGVELVKQVHVEDPSVRMLVCSMHDETLYAERALRAGAMGYLNKGEPAENMIQAIRTVLAGRIYASEELADRVLRRVSRGTDSPGDSPLDALSDRELEVLGLLGKGLSTRQIADHLHLSTKTIDTYREHLKTKLNLENANELLRFAVAWSLDPNTPLGSSGDGG